MYRPIVSASIAALLLSQVQTVAAATIYATGFESPTFQAGQLLPGLDGWTNNLVGPNAAVISTLNPQGGSQAVRVNGANLTSDAALPGYVAGSYRKVVNFNAGAAALPRVRVEVDARIDGPATADQFLSAHLGVFATDGSLAEFSLSSDGRIYAGPNFQNYLFEQPASLGQYHHLQADINFSARTVTYLANGQIMGSLPFNPAITSSILSRGSLVVYAVDPPPTFGEDKSAYTISYDNFSITALPAAPQPVYQAAILHVIDAPAGFVGPLITDMGMKVSARPGQWAGSGFSLTGEHALLWNSPASAAVDLHPPGYGVYASSRVTSHNGSKQVGYVEYSQMGNTQRSALLWSGTAASVINLSPTNLPAIIDSQALGISPSGGQQVGSGIVDSSFMSHALLWSSTANSAVDLNPNHLSAITQGTVALGTDGVHQVGEGYTDDNRFHAVLWSGSAATAVDLHPTHLSHFTDSSAEGVSGNQQVGAAGSPVGNTIHAMLWNGTAESAVDLHPTNLPDFYQSFARSTNGFQQVGTGIADFNRALVWSGTADSAVDLHAFLPWQVWPFHTSEADWIDAQGNVYGEASKSDGENDVYAVKWTPQSIYLEADFNRDHAVNAADLAAWRQGVGIAAGATRAQGDADGDHDVDGADFLTWQRQLGATTPAYVATVFVPEPATSMLVFAAALVARAIGRRVQTMRDRPNIRLASP
jgi:hypothetical protein